MRIHVTTFLESLRKSVQFLKENRNNVSHKFNFMAPNYEILGIDVHENRIRGANMYDKSVETNLEKLVQTETFHLHH